MDKHKIYQSRETSSRRTYLGGLFMLEAVYHNGFFITGTVQEVRMRLRDHVEKYRTIAELLESLAPQ